MSALRRLMQAVASVRDAADHLAVRVCVEGREPTHCTLAEFREVLDAAQANIPDPAPRLSARRKAGDAVRWLSDAIQTMMNHTQHGDGCSIIPCSCGLSQCRSDACVLRTVVSDDLQVANAIAADRQRILQHARRIREERRVPFNDAVADPAAAARDAGEDQYEALLADAIRASDGVPDVADLWKRIHTLTQAGELLLATVGRMVIAGEKDGPTVANQPTLEGAKQAMRDALRTAGDQ